LRTRRAALSHRTFHSWSFSKPIERIELLRPTTLRFRVLLGAGSINELEIVRWKVLRYKPLHADVPGSVGL
jgi:hypothetical protein